MNTPVPSQGRITLRTITVIRWVAIGGQLLAVLVSHELLEWGGALWPALATVLAALLVNVSSLLLRRGPQPVQDSGAAWHFAFDIGQLSVLLYFTGGLANPFCILLLAPLTVAATVLSFRSVVVLTLLTVVAVAALGIWSMPLPWSRGVLPPVYALGLWLALASAAVFIASYVWRVAQQARQQDTALYAMQGMLAAEQQRSALGAMAAAVAHELGSPLATIQVTVQEMAREISPDDPLRPDIELLQEQAARCRTILAEFARRPEMPPASAATAMPWPDYLRQLAERYERPTIGLSVVLHACNEGPVPRLLPRPELSYALGNLVQNAQRHAATRVTMLLHWDGAEVGVRIGDDGPGFRDAQLARLGEPYLTEGAAGMGLGIFIARTLLQQMGGGLDFANQPDAGALAIVRLPRALFVSSDDVA